MYLRHRGFYSIFYNVFCSLNAWTFDKYSPLEARIACKGFITRKTRHCGARYRLFRVFMGRLTYVGICSAVEAMRVSSLQMQIICGQGSNCPLLKYYLRSLGVPITSLCMSVRNLLSGYDHLGLRLRVQHHTRSVDFPFLIQKDSYQRTV